jgi:hypothetical protein
MVSVSEARRVALSFPETSEEGHHGIPSFRVAGKIFATVPDGEHLRVLLDADATHAAISDDPAACEELWWGKKLSGVCVTLARADHRRLHALLDEAWRRVAPRRLQVSPDDGTPALGTAPRRRTRTRR